MNDFQVADGQQSYAGEISQIVGCNRPYTHQLLTCSVVKNDAGETDMTYGGLSAGILTVASDLKDLEDEKPRIKQTFSDLGFKNRALKNVIEI